MIEAKGLTKKYGNFRALDKVSFEVRKGEVVGFLGPNGAGKSTTMRILTCYLSASGGTAKVHGHDVFDAPLEVRNKIGYLPQRATMYGEMSVWDYLQFVSELRSIPSSNFRKRMKDVVEVCGLSRVLGKDIGTLSHGYRQRVGLGQALIHDPPILILDEPTSDLDPNEKAEVIDYIQEIGQHRTVILSTHNLAEVEAACARAIIISKGRVVADGGLDDVRARGGRVRYEIVVDETEGLRNGAPNAKQVQDALTAIEGVTAVKETPTDESTHAFTIMGTKTTDLRGELFRLMVDKGWILLEMSRDVQKLEDVFKTLTRGEELLDRGRSGTELDDEDFDDDDDLDDEDSVDDEEDAADDVDDEDSVDEEDDDEDDDLDDDEDDEDEDKD
ncbi:MAG: ATP-binding cassette domain-containing protein [Polyangiaceae bacterium]